MGWTIGGLILHRGNDVTVVENIQTVLDPICKCPHRLQGLMVKKKYVTVWNLPRCLPGTHGDDVTH